MRKPEYAGPWRRIRKQILERDNHQCQIQAKGCTGTATQVDHIIPTSQNGPWWDPTNLRASCAHCNNQRIDRTKQDKWKTTNTHITLITGPPSAGKTTHAKNHARPGHLIIDYNEILRALGGDQTTTPPRHPLRLAAADLYGSLIKKTRKGEIPVPHIWITTTKHDAADRYPHHDHIELDPGQEETLRRLTQRGDPPYMADVVREIGRAHV